MPRFDKTGPSGQGPMTGRGLGPCGGGQAFGRGRGLGRGFARGLGRGFGGGYAYRQPTQAEELANAKAYIQDLKTELKDSENYLKDLETKK